jgi:hypothetical protein
MKSSTNLTIYSSILLWVITYTGVWSQKGTSHDTIMHVSPRFVLKELRGKTNDTATAEYDHLVLANGAIENDCGKPVCTIRIHFTNSLPDLDLEAYDIHLESTYDLNRDGIKEILVYHWWVEHSWTTISVYSLIHNHWIELKSVKAFVVDDADFKNRVVQKGAAFYLKGNRWNSDYSRILSHKVLIPKNLIYKQHH